MNDDQLSDLKQFITATVSQTEAKLTDRFDALENKVDTLETKVDDGFAGVGEALDDMNTLFNERLTKLEKQAA